VGRKRHGQQRQRDLRGELGATTQRNPDQAQTLIKDTCSYDALNRLSAVSESSLEHRGRRLMDLAVCAELTPMIATAIATINQANTWGTSIRSQTLA